MDAGFFRCALYDRVLKHGHGYGSVAWAVLRIELEAEFSIQENHEAIHGRQKLAVLFVLVGAGCQIDRL
jgi:hypothetical protein